jgi:hypothetical protein
MQQTESSAPAAMLFPVSRANRSQDLAGAVRVSLPHILNELIRDLDAVISEQIGRLEYLGPLRSYPPRHLAFTEHHDANWRAGGGYAWDVLRRDSTVRNRVNAWLGADWLRTNYAVLVRDLVPLSQLEQPLIAKLEQIQDEGLKLETDYDDEGPSGVYPVVEDPEAEAKGIVEYIAASNIDHVPELVLVDRRSDTFVSHRDVGIGISQVLPVLVSCYGLQNQIITIEQPEIHLHPALQAELGDVFIQSALGNNKNAFILETHSEHLILRIMRRIRDTTDSRLPSGIPAVKPDDVSVLFIEPTKSGSVVRVLELDSEGDFIDPWPGGFFEEGFKERFI